MLCISPILTACSLSSQQKADYGAVRYGTDSAAIYDKMEKGDSLSLDDIMTLSRANVNQNVIIRYLREHGTVYILSDNDVQSLRQARVAPDVINYMKRSSQVYRPRRYPAIGIGDGYDPYFDGPTSPIPNGYPNHDR